MDDAAKLVAQILGGPASALELFARQWCDCPEDVVQESLLKLAKERPLPTKPMAWLYCVVRREAINARRSAERRRKHETQAAGQNPWFTAPGDTIGTSEATIALSTLPLEQREIIVAHLWGKLTFAEIGELVGCSSSSAQRRYASGIVALRERLGLACQASMTKRKPV